MEMLTDSTVLVVLALLTSTCAATAHAEEQSSSYRYGTSLANRSWCDFGLYDRANSASWSTASGYHWAGGLGPAGHRDFWAEGALRMAISNMPLPLAIDRAAKTGKNKLLVSDAAREIIRASDERVSLLDRYKSKEQLLRRVLTGTGVRLTKIGNTIRLFADGEEPKQVEFSPISRLGVEYALARHLPLQMDQAPIQMALEMVKGFTGLRITYGSNEDRSWMGGPLITMGGPLITIHANGRSVAEVLEDLASQVDCEVKVLDDRVELSRRERN